MHAMSKKGSFINEVMWKLTYSWKCVKVSHFFAKVRLCSKVSFMLDDWQVPVCLNIHFWLVFHCLPSNKIPGSCEIWMFVFQQKDAKLPREEFVLTANSLGAHMKVTESSPGMGHSELILRTFI